MFYSSSSLQRDQLGGSNSGKIQFNGAVNTRGFDPGGIRKLIKVRKKDCCTQGRSSVWTENSEVAKRLLRFQITGVAKTTEFPFTSGVYLTYVKHKTCDSITKTMTGEELENIRQQLGLGVVGEKKDFTRGVTRYWSQQKNQQHRDTCERQ